MTKRFNKKGIALETAIVFLVVIFSFCTLVSTTALVGSKQGKIEKIRIENKAKLDQIGEKFVAGDLQEGIVGDNEFYVKKIESQQDNTITLQVWYGSKVSGNADLTVVLEKGADDKVTVKQWYYATINQNSQQGDRPWLKSII